MMRRGVVNTEVNERQRPNVNSRILKYYPVGSTLHIVDEVLGDPYDGDDVWYKLANGAFVWAGAVDVEVNISELPEQDKFQWLISFRERRPDGRPDMGSKDTPKSLYFTHVKLPADSSGVRLNDLMPNPFANGVLQSMKGLPDSRKHVFIYVHGYQLLSSLKLNLLEHFVNNYMRHAGNKIGKVIFMTWPAQGGPSRKTVDDRSIRAGQDFTRNGLWQTFEELSRVLSAEGKCLNLLVHSFGHQFLNGMINPEPEDVGKLPDSKIFENVFLMAPDVTHLTIKKGGANLKNYYNDRGAKQFHYQFSGLKDISKNVYVFHDKYDYLLYASTKKFVGAKTLTPDMTARQRFDITKDYRNLGNYGTRQTAATDLEPGFQFISVEDLIDKNEPMPDGDYPFRRIRNGPGQVVDNVWDNADYAGVNSERVIFNAKRFPDHHRYLFTCRPVVDEVLRLL